MKGALQQMQGFILAGRKDQGMSLLPTQRILEDLMHLTQQHSFQSRVFHIGYHQIIYSGCQL